MGSLFVRLLQFLVLSLVSFLCVQVCLAQPVEACWVKFRGQEHVFVHALGTEQVFEVLDHYHLDSF